MNLAQIKGCHRHARRGGHAVHDGRARAVEVPERGGALRSAPPRCLTDCSESEPTTGVLRAASSPLDHRSFGSAPPSRV
jgi:hypothetical protein